jgi:hypothetical protein
MNRNASHLASSFCRLFLLGLAFAIFAITGPLLRANDELATARAALAYFSSSIESLHGRYTFKFGKSKLPPRPGAVKMEQMVDEREFVFQPQTGRLYVNEMSSWIYSRISKTERFSHRTIRAYDGEQYHALMHTATTSPMPGDIPREQPFNLNIFGANQSDVYFEPWHWAGLPAREMPGPLSAILSLKTAAYSGEEKIDGVVCQRFDVLEGARLYSVWLDPAHGWLPRSQEYRPYQGSLKATKRAEAKVAFRTHEFRQFSDREGTIRLWFPARGEAVTRIGTKSFELVDLTLNAPIDLGQFRIDPKTLPDGVRVTYDGGRPGFVTGGRKDLYDQIDALMTRKTAVMDQILRPEELRGQDSPPQVRATPPPLLAWPWWVGGASALLICLALFLRFVHRA